MQVQTLWAGQHIDAGTVSVDVSGSGGSETAWSDGTRFAPRGMWGMYFSTTFERGCDDTPAASVCGEFPAAPLP